MMRKFVLIWLLGALLLALPGKQVFAGGSASYPNGAEAFLIGVVPPPGFYVTNYAYYYEADELLDNSGDEIGVFDEATVWAVVPRFIWISQKKFLGADYGQHLFVVYLDTTLEFNAPVGPENKRKYHDSGVGYMIYSPMLLGYHLLQGKLHLAISAVDIFIPTGQDDGNLATVGRNFWTFEPVAALTYLHNNWDFSIKLMYDFSTTQDDAPTVFGVDVDRTPGQEFHTDFGVSYSLLSDKMRLGISGYYYKQTTDDDYQLTSDIPAPVQALLRDEESNRSEVFAIGPGIWYNHKNMFFSLRSQWETGAKNKTEGMNVWFKFTYAF